MDDIRDLIRKYHSDWAARGKWTPATNQLVAIAFLGDEVNELRTAYDERQGTLEQAMEAFDAFMMAHVAADNAGTPLAFCALVRNPDSMIKTMTETFFKINRANLGLRQEYYRNNPGGADWDELGRQLSYMASLAVGFVQGLGLDFATVARQKLEQMEAKRK